MLQLPYPKVYLYKRIVQAKLFIDDNFTANIDLEQIADEACFSRFHFLWLFKKTYGKTRHQYLVHKRIELVCELLKKGHSVSEACYESGFESLGSFSTLFKKSMGSSPSAYQDFQLRMKADMVSRPLGHVPGCFAGVMKAEVVKSLKQPDVSWLRTSP